MKKIGLLFSVSTILFFSCSNEKEIIIQNTANPKYDLGMSFEKIDNEQVKQMNDVHSLIIGEIGNIIHDTIVAQWLKPVHNKLYMVSKNGDVLSEVLEHKSYGNEHYLKIYGEMFDLEPYSRGITTEHIVCLLPYSYNDLIFYGVNILGKSIFDNKNYCMPLALMINTQTKVATVIGTGFCIDGQSIAVSDDKYLCIIDFYMESDESIYKYYDIYGNYVGWTPNTNLVYTNTKERFYYTRPLETTNWDWKFTYANDKYGRPVTMKNSNEKYEIKYTTTGYHITVYDDKDRKTADYEQNDVNDFFDLRNWDLKFIKGGKLTKYNYDSRGVLDTKKYYNGNMTYYLLEKQISDGSLYCRGIYENSGEYTDDILIDVDDFWGECEIYRNDPQTGRRIKLAELPKKQAKRWLLDYLYKLN